MRIIPFTILLLSLWSACSPGRRQGEILVHKVQRCDFVDKVTVPGEIEAIKTYSVACPGLRTDGTIIWLIPEGTHVEKGDTVCIIEARELENDYKQAVAELENARAEYNKSVADLNLQYLLLESQVMTIESSTEITRLDSMEMAYSPPLHKKLIELEIKKAEIEKGKLVKKLEFLQIINESELRKMRTKIDQARNRVDRTKTELDKLWLKTDVAGMVTYAVLWTSGVKVREGDVVWSVMPIITIPDMSGMQVKLTVNETHFKRIEKDQEVRITLDAFPDIRLNGVITKKTPMGKPVKKNSEVKEFEVYASIDSTGFSIQPGISVTCDVIVNAVPDTIVIPLMALFEQDSSKIVYLAKDGQYCQQAVECGGNSDNHAIIAAGLQPDDVIALGPPAEDLLIQ